VCVGGGGGGVGGCGCWCVSVCCVCVGVSTRGKNFFPEKQKGFRDGLLYIGIVEGFEF